MLGKKIKAVVVAPIMYFLFILFYNRHAENLIMILNIYVKKISHFLIIYKKTKAVAI